MSNKRELITGILYGIATILFLIGLLPWDMISKIIACIFAVLAIRRIRSNIRENKSVKVFTISYVAVIVVSILLLNALSA